MKVRDILNHLLPGVVDFDDYEDVDYHLAEQFKLLGAPQMTGGADWSADSVWKLHPRVQRLLGLKPRNPKIDVFLIWSEGEPDETLIFLAGLADYKLGGYRTKYIRDFTVEDLRKLEREGLLRRSSKR